MAVMGYPLQARASQRSAKYTPSIMSLAHLSVAGFVLVGSFIVVLARDRQRESVVFGLVMAKTPCVSFPIRHTPRVSSLNPIFGC